MATSSLASNSSVARATQHAYTRAPIRLQDCHGKGSHLAVPLSRRGARMPYDFSYRRTSSPTRSTGDAHWNARAHFLSSANSPLQAASAHSNLTPANIPSRPHPPQPSSQSLPMVSAYYCTMARVASLSSGFHCIRFAASLLHLMGCGGFKTTSILFIFVRTT
jgi:hypothetical protein